MQYFDQIPGLSIQYNYVTEEEEEALLQYFDRNIWYSNFLFRLQYYGYEELYNGEQRVETENKIEHSLNDLRSKVSETTRHTFDQVIVREFKKGQGLINYKDPPNIDNKIAIVSLNYDGQYIFSSSEITYNFFIPRRSLLVLEGDNWSYSMDSSSKLSQDERRIYNKDDDYRRIETVFRLVSK